MMIKHGHLEHPAVIKLLDLHLRGMHENSPVDSVHALDLSGLQTHDMDFWTVWDSETLLGCGALKDLDGQAGEIKSMRTHPDHLRKGVGALILEHIFEISKARGYERLSLETGSGEAFEAALTLYRKYGFANGGAFGAYKSTPFNQFLHLILG